MGYLSKLRSLSLFDYYVLLWAVWVLPWVGLRLRSQGFKKLYSWAIGELDDHAAATIEAQNRSEKLGRLINFVAAHGLYRANCLCRSLVLLKALQREGLQGELKIGVPEKESGQPRSVLDAHAWVEYRGVVINDHHHVAEKHAVFDLD